MNNHLSTVSNGLQTVDRWCADNDIASSQFVRRRMTDRVKSLGLEYQTSAPIEERQTWFPET